MNHLYDRHKTDLGLSISDDLLRKKKIVQLGGECGTVMLALAARHPSGLTSGVVVRSFC